MMQALKAIVFYAKPGDRYRAGRTLRALGRANVHAAELDGLLPNALKAFEGDAGVWLVAAGHWPLRPPTLPPPSTRGMPLCALGAVHALNTREEAALSAEWSKALETCGGDLQTSRKLPPLASLFVEGRLVTLLREALEEGESLETIAARWALQGEARLVRWRPIDVAGDDRLRVAQVITSLQVGGAERVALDLAACLPEAGRFGIASPVIVTGRPTREAFDTPPACVDVSTAEGGREGRMAAAAAAALGLHVDAVHVHLLSAKDVAPFRAAGLPVAMTLHNLRQGWPPGIESVGPADAELLVACAKDVERAARDAGLSLPVRTAWNGIAADALAATPGLVSAAQILRNSWEIRLNDLVLLALANPRPQKRLHLLPAIVRATQERLNAAGDSRQVHLVIAGEPADGLPEALEAATQLEAEIQRCGLGGRIRQIGTVRAIGPLLHAADVLVSTSAWEGLSLAQLEAVAAGVPVVATAVGGTVELASLARGITLLSTDADVAEFAGAIIASTSRRKALPPQLPGHFERHTMAWRYGQLYPRAIERARCTASRTPRRGLWLITNNFSTGGAQSSARRLLLALQRRGWPVRAAVVQEHPGDPTPGRQALENAGIKVVSVPPPPPIGDTDPALAVEELLEALDADPPEAVVFWNLITQYKVLLADLLLDVPVFDVSPGEMYFSSLDAYFAAIRPGLPYRSGREYGQRLAGMIVKYSAERAAAEALGAPVHVVPNGVDVPAAIPQRRPCGGVLRLGTAARLSPQKKLEELFDALRQVQRAMPSFVLRIAGGPDGSNEAYAQSLKESAWDLPVEWLGETDVAAFLRGLDLFVMISEPAGCPNASLEAMAAGLPVIATDCGGAGEQVVDQVTGRLVPRANPAALGQAIVEAAWNPMMLARWGEAGWRHAAARFSIDRMADDYARIFFNADSFAPGAAGTALDIGLSMNSVTPSVVSGVSSAER